MKAIMISIKPKYVADILNGNKTIEIRKTMPKCDLPIDVYIYCTKDDKNDCFINISFNYHRCNVRPKPTNKKWFEKLKHIQILNGKVVAKFTLKHIDNLSNHFTTPYLYTKETCLTWEEILNYRNNGLCYAWHISNLEIFDKPKELSEFKHYKKFSEIDYMLPIPRKETCERLVALTKAPQSWCYIHGQVIGGNPL